MLSNFSKAFESNMADAKKARSSRQGQDKGKRPRQQDPEEGSSQGRPAKSRNVERDSVPKPSSSRSSKEEERCHKAIEKAFLKLNRPLAKLLRLLLLLLLPLNLPLHLLGIILKPQLYLQIDLCRVN